MLWLHDLETRCPCHDVYVALPYTYKQQSAVVFQQPIRQQLEHIPSAMASTHGSKPGLATHISSGPLTPLTSKKEPLSATAPSINDAPATTKHNNTWSGPAIVRKICSYPNLRVILKLLGTTSHNEVNAEVMESLLLRVFLSSTSSPCRMGPPFSNEP